MKKFLKKNYLVIIAFSLPVLLVVGVALSVYLPAFFLSTDYNFIYSTCADGNSYNYSQCNDYLKKKYSVVNNKLTVNNVPNEKDLNFSERLFLHNNEKNESREITLAEAQGLNLSNLLTSPDGVTISYSYERGTYFLFSRSNSTSGYYLTKGKSKKKVNLINQSDSRYGYYGRDNFHFIGWVLNNNN